MLTRRTFLKSTSFVAGSLFIPPVFNFNKKYIGLQLYTVREAMEKNPHEALARVAQIGYNSVEGASYSGPQNFYGMDAAEFASVLKANGLIMPSSHYRLGEEVSNGEILKGTILHEWDKAVDDAARLDLKYMVCAWLSEAERGTIEHYKKLAGHLNIAGARCKKAGIQLCYHNHDFEFLMQGNQLPYNILLHYTDKDLVKFEVDLYWITKAQQDPFILFEKHPERFPLWHVKDMDRTPEKAFTEVGNGIIDFKKIFTYANTAGMKYFFVEQDKTPGDPFESVDFSIRYIKKNLV